MPSSLLRLLHRLGDVGQRDILFDVPELFDIGLFFLVHLGFDGVGDVLHLLEQLGLEGLLHVLHVGCPHTFYGGRHVSHEAVHLGCHFFVHVLAAVLLVLLHYAEIWLDVAHALDCMWRVHLKGGWDGTLVRGKGVLLGDVLILSFKGLIL